MSNPKETIEEAAEKYAHNYFNMHETNNYKALKTGFEEGAKWKAERMCSEEELHNAFYNGWIYRGEDYSFPKAKKEWFEQFKKK